MTTATAIQLTGKIIEWHPVQGWGKILSDRKVYYAHVKHFVGECACGHLHKCEIEEGMDVKFTPTHEAFPRDRLPSALEIRVKDGRK
jgi:hypothetical protein